MRKSSTKAVVMKTLLNAFNVNDLQGGDEISISVYSDVVDDMFKCGQFNFKAGDAVDFHDLVVPCQEVITVTITELDGTKNNGHTVFVPCKVTDDMTVDLVVPKGSVDRQVDTISNINGAMSIINLFNPFFLTRMGIQIATSITGMGLYVLKASGTEEHEALYNLRIAILEDEVDWFYMDERILDYRCNATQISFKKGSSFEFQYDKEAPFHVEFKNLVNSYGVSNSADGKDTLNMYIYSDYLRKPLKVPQFDVQDREIVMFSDLSIPCVNELLVNVMKAETETDSAFHNTIRVECNN